jgi:response regulator NasT
MNILIAEDEFLITLTLKVQLEAMGHTVVGTSRDGEAAVALAKQLRPDLVLMDIGMPGMDGIAATAEIMAQAPVPIVMLTAHNDRQRVQQAMRAGAAAYLLKPISESQLKRAIGASVARFNEANTETPQD